MYYVTLLGKAWLRGKFRRGVLTQCCFFMYVYQLGNFPNRGGRMDFLWRSEIFLCLATDHNFFEAPWDNFVKTLRQLWLHWLLAERTSAAWAAYGHFLSVFFKMSVWWLQFSTKCSSLLLLLRNGILEIAFTQMPASSVAADVKYGHLPNYWYNIRYWRIRI